MPLVSVIIAAYGKPEYLNVAVQSVCKQTCGDYEIIVVDDCSGDDIVARYCLPERARLLCHEKRFGAAAATRNTGLRAANGEYVAFLDQDDVWLPEKLAIQVKALEQNPRAALTFCHYTAVDESLHPLPEQRRARKSVRDPLKKMIAGCFIRTPSTVLARLIAIRECGMFDESVIGTSDWDLYLRLARRYVFVAVPEPLVLYRMHPEQLHRKTAVIRSATLRVMDKTLEWVRSDRPELQRRVERFYGRILRKIGSSQLRDQSDPALALDTLRKARRMRPWDVRIHGLIFCSMLANHNRPTGGE
jgi:glycosyltransferase involved in cell wall biosynthesis